MSLCDNSTCNFWTCEKLESRLRLVKWKKFFFEKMQRSSWKQVKTSKLVLLVEVAVWSFQENTEKQYIHISISTMVVKENKPFLKLRKLRIKNGVLKEQKAVFIIFFAVYVIYKKNYSFSGVVFLFFFRAKLPTLFIQK